MGNYQKRLYPHEAKKLGLKVKQNDPGRSNARYYLTPGQERSLDELRYTNDKIKRLFFDIETTPMVVYSWRVGFKIDIPPENIIDDWQIICVSYKWQGDDKVHTVDWSNGEKEMLQEFIDIMDQADECVAHNGDRFDVRKLRTRCIKHRVPMMPHYRTLDTLKKARGGFRFNSNRLTYIAQYLGVGEKMETGGFQLWKDVMSGDEKALAKMSRYCEKDVILLEDVYTKMVNYIKPNTHAGVTLGSFKYSCPVCGCEDTTLLKNLVTARGTIQRVMECDECEHTYPISNSAYMLKLKL